MKKIAQILFIVLFASEYILSVEKISTLENILIVNKTNFTRITLLFNKQIDFTSEKKNDVIEVNLSNIQFAGSFPGSEIEVKSGYFKSLNFQRESNSKVKLKINTTNVNDYNISFLKDSKSIIIDIYNPLELSSPDLRFRNSIKMNSNGKPDAALREFRKLVAENYSNPEMYFYAGLIRESMGYYYQAKSNLSNAKNLGVEYPDLYARLAEVYDKLDQKDNSIQEQKRFIEEFDKLKKSSLDTGLAIVNKQIKSLILDDSVMLAQNKTDSQKAALAKNGPKPGETKIIKSEPIKTDSYYYTLILNIAIIVVSVGCIFSIWLVVRKGSKKKKGEQKVKETKKQKKKNVNLDKKPGFEGINLLNDEVISSPPMRKVPFNDFINEYKKNEVKPQEISEPEKKVKQEIQQPENQKITTNEISELAKKYHVEQDKVELALKLMSKNEKEDIPEKYRIVVEMLRQNKSIEELSKQLRIPRGEIDLITSLNEL